MAKKESYFSKHKEKLAETDGAPTVFSLKYQATEEQKAAFAEGAVICIDKPLHWTSFDVVRKIRNTIGIKKVGHAGTLDPLATGVLIVCTGKFTKKINEYMAARKAYDGTITLGATTPTYDLESAPENMKEVNITVAQIDEEANKFVGDILQYPPIYSAIKKDGEALYKLARRGETVELKARPVTIESFEIISVKENVITFKVICGTGTYIRSLANDLGAALGCGGYLSALQRTAVGDFTIESAQTLEEFLSQFPLLDAPKKDS